MATEVDQVSGHWAVNGFPDIVTIDNRQFKKAEWACDICYADVIAQYRENQPYNAGHLFVYKDMTYVIDHTDKYNPDHGLAWEHGVADVLPAVANVVGPILIIGGLVGIGIAIARRA